MDFPITAEFAESANIEQLHDDARADSPEWPATVVRFDDGTWAYRVDDSDEYVETDPETGDVVECTRPREDVVIDAEHVRAAIDNHVPVWPAPAPDPLSADEITALRALLGS